MYTISCHLYRQARATLLVCTVLASASAIAQTSATLPAEVEAALARAKVPVNAVTVLVTDADGRAPARLSHRANVPVNPASIIKLVTTWSALEMLGPAYAWSTPVFVDGTISNGTLRGNLHIRGQGDPKLVVERLWLLLRRVQALGINNIAGDIVLDRSAFETVQQDPGAFDGEPLRPYNAAPDALLLNFKSVIMTFVPDRTANVAQVSFEPPLAGVQMQQTVPLTAVDCSDYRGTLKPDFSDPARIRFTGSYPATCGERSWPVAYADPKSYAARAVEGMWRQSGGKLTGSTREGPVPAGLKPAFEAQSPPLAEVIRDINKYSNNVMAQQVFLTLSLQQKGAGTLEGSREIVSRWWRERVGGPAEETPVMDNGSGLSRSERITANALTRLLQSAWASPMMPELMSSLPITGVDGTLKRSRAKTVGAAHLKTGSLNGVTGVAGYVHAAGGRRYVLVFICNHPNAGAVRPAVDALIDWAAKE